MNGQTSGELSPRAGPLLWWAAAAAVAAGAASVVARSDTPIDAALPFVIAVMMGVAALTHASVALVVPLLLGGAIALPDERQRLLWCGLAVAAAFAGAILVQGRRPPALQSAALTVAAVLLLRWIPLGGVLIGREVLILALAVAITILLGATPLAIAVAVATALFTTAVPLRTLALPITVAVAAAVIRWAGLPPIRFPALSAAALAVMLAFYPWSGAFARALPVMLRGGVPRLERIPVHIALPPGTSAEVDIPPAGRGLILSGANVPRLERGTVMGTIQPGGIIVRIGDVADWGVLRREHYHGRRNPLPRRPGGMIRGYGQTAWIDASGRVTVAPGRVTVTADPGLPSNAALQIDAIEMAP